MPTPWSVSSLTALTVTVNVVSTSRPPVSVARTRDVAGHAVLVGGVIQCQRSGRSVDGGGVEQRPVFVLPVIE